MNGKSACWKLGAVIGIVGAAAAFAWLNRRSRLDVGLPWGIFQRGLAAKLGTDRSEDVVQRAVQIYDGLVQRQEPPENPHLNMHLYRRILPGLALYRTLIELYGGNKERALSSMEAPFHAWVVANYGTVMRMIRMLPGKRIMFRLGLLISMEQYPIDGWITNWTERSKGRLAFEMVSCYYLKTLTALKAPELTSLYCQMDEWMGGMLPPEIRFRRSQNLARGGQCCDFSYELEVINKQPLIPQMDLDKTS